MENQILQRKKYINSYNNEYKSKHNTKIQYIWLVINNTQNRFVTK